ncbi:MAG: phosphoglycerate mutase family protein [Gracilimonas sp.]|nr:phosphoglycerate mutase family protein [Gracilimonas sp.]
MKKRLISCHQIIKLILLITILLPFDHFAKTTETDLTTIILVRHAEKVDNSTDPDLSEVGYERVERFTSMFQNVPIDAIFSTDFKRTLETATPLAEMNNLEIQYCEYQNASLEVEKWIQEHNGDTILISGHSTTTPSVANAILGEEHFENNFEESDYGNILIITISSDGDEKLLHLRY